MNFKLTVKLTEEDYLDCNLFMLFKSKQGRAQIVKFRIIIAVMVLVASLLSLIGGKFTMEAFIGIIPYFILLAAIQLALKPFCVLILKNQVKNLKKQAKTLYSPLSEMEFFEDHFEESTPENKTELKYSGIYQVYAIENKAVYICVSNAQMYIIPSNCFESREQNSEFLNFIKAKISRFQICR